MAISQIGSVPHPIAGLLEPFGYAEIAWDYAGVGAISIDMILISSIPLETAAEVRAYVHSRATEALNSLEASGYQIRASTVTIKGQPMECTMRIEAAKVTVP